MTWSLAPPSTYRRRTRAAAVHQARSPALIAAIRQAGSGRRRSDRAFALALELLIVGIASVVERSEEPETDRSPS